MKWRIGTLSIGEAVMNFLLISAMFYKFKENTAACLNYREENDINRFTASDRFFDIKITEISQIWHKRVFNWRKPRAAL
jgi:hypothetical protein